MEDASGRSIRQRDLVAFTRSSAGGAHGDRGRVLDAKPSDRNTLSVVCVDGATVEVEPSYCTVIDRSFLYPGIVVSSASDPGGQLGVVTGVHTALDLVRLNVDGEGHHQSVPVAIATGVSPGELRRVRELSLGDYVVSGGWLGRVVEVFLDVDVALDGGGGDACRVTDAGSKLSTVHGRDGLSLYTNSVFYPGQRVVGHWSVFKASKWLRGYWKPNRNSGTVTKVEIAGVLVYWDAPSRLGTDREELVMASAPPAYQKNPKNLTYFSSPPICYWSIGDRCFFRQGTPSTPTESSSSSSSGDHQEPPCAHPHAHELARASRNRPRKTAMDRLRRREGRRGHEHDAECFERPMSVINTHTTADVVWQDGTRWRGVPSASLLPFMKRNEHEFLPGQHVVRVRGGEGSVAIDGGESAAARTTVAPRAGIVRSIDCKDQTVSVSWLNAAEMHSGEHNVLGSEEEMLSAYDLGIDDRSKVFYGNVVVRRHGDAAVPVPGDLSWVGHVTDLCQDGQVLVKWGDGHTSKVIVKLLCNKNHCT